ncbi:MAG: hypothetical protein JW804_08810 [Sedimentisphaerales bacterium]|nr:hypothetical protein [Sedimentisphaerales bacterium]
MYRTIMIIGIIVLAVGWAAYGIYCLIMNHIEKKRPKVRSEKFQQAQSSMKEYAEKLAKFEKKRYDKKE